jgi:glucosamine-phosphate N-acetyltransferase
MNNIIFRNIHNNDINKNILNILNQLSPTTHISKNKFYQFLKSLNNLHQIIVIEDTLNNKIIGIGSILIEQKIIHNMGKVAHIEDIVIDKNYRKMSLGTKLIKKLKKIAINNKCYKIILNCNEKLIKYYEKQGFIPKNIQMAIYF